MIQFACLVMILLKSIKRQYVTVQLSVYWTEGSFDEKQQIKVMKISNSLLNLSCV